jgi:hypothetical protein
MLIQPTDPASIHHYLVKALGDHLAEMRAITPERPSSSDEGLPQVLGYPRHEVVLAFVFDPGERVAWILRLVKIGEPRSRSSPPGGPPAHAVAAIAG